MDVPPIEHHCYVAGYDCQDDCISRFMEWLYKCDDEQFEKFLNFHFEFNRYFFDRLLRYYKDDLTIED